MGITVSTLQKKPGRLTTVSLFGEICTESARGCKNLPCFTPKFARLQLHRATAVDLTPEGDGTL